MSIVCFTLCSNNYLAHAKTLGNSILKFNPDIRVVIGLVDEKDPSIDYSLFEEFELLGYNQLGYSEFQDMLSRYNIIEFNTAVKPFYFEILFRNHPEVDQIFYIDPDIVFYQSPELLAKAWEDAEILLTPNLIYLPEKTVTGELASLRHGINNLGFIGLKRGKESFKLIAWWKERLIYHCRIDKCNGIFVDQKWIDLAPLFFSKIKSVKDPGWNMAWWNLSERKLLLMDTGYAVNESVIPLVFFHFSGFKPEQELMTERLKSVDFELDQESDLKGLFEAYKNSLLQNGYNKFSKLKPLLNFYKEPNTLWIRIGKKIKSKSTNAIYRIFKVR